VPPTWRSLEPAIASAWSSPSRLTPKTGPTNGAEIAWWVISWLGEPVVVLHIREDGWAGHESLETVDRLSARGRAGMARLPGLQVSKARRWCVAVVVWPTGELSAGGPQCRTRKAL
jgi:hypothetical protein